MAEEHGHPPVDGIHLGLDAGTHEAGCQLLVCHLEQLFEGIEVDGHASVIHGVEGGEVGIVLEHVAEEDECHFWCREVE